MVHVVLAADENYAIPMSVTIVSTMENAQSASKFTFYLLVPDNFSKQIVDKIMKIEEIYSNCKIEILHMKESFSDICMRIKHITSPTYYRLLAADLLQCVDKCIYLDVDIVVETDLTELANIDLDGYYLAGVKAPGYHYRSEERKNFCTQIGIPSIDQYINAGVLVMNLSKIREDKITNEFIKLSRKNFPTQDQDVINVACYNKIKHLPFQYNVMVNRLYETDMLGKIFSSEDIYFARNKPAIIHYVDKKKPWKDLTCSFSDKWWKYAALSPFIGEAVNYNFQAIVRNVQNLNDEMCSVYASTSFKIGRSLTLLPRLARDFITNISNIIKKYGFHYLFWKIRNKVFSISLTEYDYYKSLKPKYYPVALSKWYARVTVEDLNLNKPETYNAKIQWLKLYDNTPLKAQLADKYNVRKWVEEKIGSQYLIPLLGVWNRFEDIDFDGLPDRFVLKTTHGSGWNAIIKNKNEFDYHIEKQRFDSWMQLNFAFKFGLELHYSNIIPRIIAEQYIGNNADLFDYKFLCFDGKVHYIWVDSERYTSHKRDVFDVNWNLQPFTIKYSNSNVPPERPSQLEKMVEFAERLSIGFYHVRVDFYQIEQKVYFGEMTFTSGSGTEKIEPSEYAYKLGELIKLPLEK